VGVDERSPGALVTGGVFRFTRNPIFLFLDAYFLGAFLINGTVFFLVAAIVAAAMNHFQVLQEERFLARRYGLEYLDYRRRTPRYLPCPFITRGVGSEAGAST
jgi:protein-S-isoprenylcysteine O-methyltransferase Ste14